MGDLEKIRTIKELCFNIMKNQLDSKEFLESLLKILPTVPKHLMQRLEPIILSCTFEFMNPKVAENKLSEDHRKLVVDVLTKLFEQISIEKANLYFNVCGYLLHQIYDQKQPNLIAAVHEEYKLSIMECICATANALSWDTLLLIYSKENVPRLSQMVYIALAVAKHEKFRKLRIAAINTLMCLARVYNDQEICDEELSNHVADIFIFFLPQLAVGLRDVAVECEKSGHKVISIAIKAWSRIVMLVMKDYRPPDDKLDILSININHLNLNGDASGNEAKGGTTKWKTVEEINNYLGNKKRTAEWYKSTDEKLFKIAESFLQITTYSHSLIRLELAEMCSLLIRNCSNTLPKSLSVLVQIVIVLSEDDDTEVRNKARSLLSNLSERMDDNIFLAVLQFCEENFYQDITKLPRIFNSFDEDSQNKSLNLLVGYINLFGKHKLLHVLHSPTHLSNLMDSLLHISELDKGEISVLEEYSSPELENSAILSTRWKKFRFFRSELVERKLLAVFHALSRPDILDILVDYLLNVYANEPDRKLEATLILNELLACERAAKSEPIKMIISLYLEPDNWNLPMDTDEDEYGMTHTLGEVKSNILQICLQLDGIGKMALVYNNDFHHLLLKTLYPVLERAGSGNVHMKEVGLQTVANISKACRYNSATELINNNSDYFSFHIVRKLKIIHRNRNVLNVFSVVMKYSNIDVLPSISDIVDGLLMDSCDLLYDKDPNSFLRVFQIFIKCLMRWLNVKPLEVPVKSQKARLQELEKFKVTDSEFSSDFSDNVMGDKTAQELYKEDMQKSEKELEDELNPSSVDEYKKAEPPTHVKLTVSMLKKTLNHLPAKDKSTKLLALDILRNGLEIIRDFEDELLPVVHLIWSPLTQRFQESEPLIVNLSFHLLETLARLSKDFIRSRTSKDVLPAILEALSKLAKESYLKDKGAVYRCSQSYKLQETILNNLGRILNYLDSLEADFVKSALIVANYLSNKQPQPLQNGAVEFFKSVSQYDDNYFKNALRNVEETYVDVDYQKNMDYLREIS